MRIPVEKLLEAAKEAALKAVAGFRMEHGHAVGRARDGKRIYDIDGKGGGKSCKVRVTSDGRVLTTNGRKPGKGPAKAAGEPTPFF